jgi:hypothetical protein
MTRTIVLVATCMLAARVAAQAPGSVDDRLRGRVDAATMASLHTVIDSASASGLPAAPLIDKALEGAAKQASGDRIVAVVRGLAGQLGAAQSILGPSATSDELTAGTAALRAGIAPQTIARLRALRSGQPVTIPLAVAAELVARGVRPDSASATVLRLAADGMHDTELAAIPRSLGSPYLAGSNGSPMQSADAVTSSLHTFITQPTAPSSKPKPQRP